MAKTRRLKFWLALIGVILIAAIGSLYLYLLDASPLPVEEMDVDNNGVITFRELFLAQAARHRSMRSGEN